MTDEEFLNLAWRCGAQFKANQFFIDFCREVERRALERANKQKAHCPAPKWNRND